MGGVGKRVNRRMLHLEDSHVVVAEHCDGEDGKEGDDTGNETKGLEGEGEGEDADTCTRVQRSVRSFTRANRKGDGPMWDLRER